MPVSIKKYNENYYYASTTASTIDSEFKKREKETKEIVNEDKKNNLDDLTDEIKKQSENFERIMKKDSHKSNNREDSKYEEKSDKKVESEEDIEKEKKMQDRTNDILNQINTYLEKEKNKDTTNNKEK